MDAFLILEDGQVFKGKFRRQERSYLRSCIQYIDDRLPGGAYGPVLSGTGCRHDISADWELRRMSWRMQNP